jgi:hypothetical protein
MTRCDNKENKKMLSLCRGRFASSTKVNHPAPRSTFPSFRPNVNFVSRPTICKIPTFDNLFVIRPFSQEKLNQNPKHKEKESEQKVEATETKTDEETQNPNIFKVSDDERNMRLEKFIQKKIPGLSFNLIQRLIRLKRVKQL